MRTLARHASLRFAILGHGHIPEAIRGNPGARSFRLSPSERVLAARASRGDVGAFSSLVRKHSQLVYRVSARMLGVQEAQDASQEVWLRVWRNIHRFRGESAFSTWLYKITVNTCLNYSKREARRRSREVSDPAQMTDLASNDTGPEAAALRGEQRERILAALDDIRVEHRAAVVLRHLEGLSYAEIAEILEVPEGTAKGWASRGRAGLLVAMVERDRGEGARR